MQTPPAESDEIDLSIVLPVFNEEQTIPTLFTRISETLATPKLNAMNCEILFVDDGSGDSSASIIMGLKKADNRVKLICLSRNFGHQAAITAGIDRSKGKAVVLLDADLQDPPEIIEKFVEEWEKGADVVYAIRKKRKENFLKRSMYYLFYRLFRKIANIEMPFDSGDFCLMDERVVDALKKLPERNRFLRGLRYWVGFNQVAIEYERDARYAGKSKYNFISLMKLAFNGIFSFSSLPLRMATFFGFITCLLGVFSMIFLVAAYFVKGASWVPGWTSLVVIIFLVGGIQLLILGAIGEYVALVYDEAKGRPNYVIREFVD